MHLVWPVGHGRVPVRQCRRGNARPASRSRSSARDSRDFDGAATLGVKHCPRPGSRTTSDSADTLGPACRSWSQARTTVGAATPGSTSRAQPGGRSSHIFDGAATLGVTCCSRPGARTICDDTLLLRDLIICCYTFLALAGNAALCLPLRTLGRLCVVALLLCVRYACALCFVASFLYRYRLARGSSCFMSWAAIVQYFTWQGVVQRAARPRPRSSNANVRATCTPCSWPSPGFSLL